MNKTIVACGIFMGLLAVILGAFGAHSLKGTISGEDLRAFETGVDYQMYHALFLLILGSINQIPETSKIWVYRIVMAGIVCFSFSLYLLALDGFMGFDFSPVGFLTPLGGLLLITGWILLAYRLFKPLNQSIY